MGRGEKGKKSIQPEYILPGQAPKRVETESQARDQRGGAILRSFTRLHFRLASYICPGPDVNEWVWVFRDRRDACLGATCIDHRSLDDGAEAAQCDHLLRPRSDTDSIHCQQLEL